MGFITSIDFKILDFIQTHVRCDFGDIVMPYITNLGSGGVFWIVISLLFFINPKTRKCGMAILVGLILSVIFGNILLKPIFARERPCWINPNIDMLVQVPRDYSFPSGHTMSSFICAFIIWFENKRYGRLMLIIAALIGFSRLYLYVHFPSDVLGGIVFAAILAYLVKLIFYNLSSKITKKFLK